MKYNQLYNFCSCREESLCDATYRCKRCSKKISFLFYFFNSRYEKIYGIRGGAHRTHSFLPFSQIPKKKIKKSKSLTSKKFFCACIPLSYRRRNHSKKRLHSAICGATFFSFSFFFESFSLEIFHFFLSFERRGRRKTEHTIRCRAFLYSKYIEIKEKKNTQN